MDLANLLYGTDMTCNFYWKLQYANTMNGLQCPKIDIHGTSLPSPLYLLLSLCTKLKYSAAAGAAGSVCS